MKSLPARLEAAARMRETLVEEETERLLTSPDSDYYYLSLDNIEAALDDATDRIDNIEAALGDPLDRIATVARFTQLIAERGGVRLDRLADAYATISYYYAKDGAEEQAERTTPSAEEIEQDMRNDR